MGSCCIKSSDSHFYVIRLFCGPLLVINTSAGLRYFHDFVVIWEGGGSDKNGVKLLQSCFSFFGGVWGRDGDEEMMVFVCLDWCKGSLCLRSLTFHIITVTYLNSITLNPPCCDPLADTPPPLHTLHFGWDNAVNLTMPRELWAIKASVTPSSQWTLTESQGNPFPVCVTGVIPNG